MSSVLSKSLLLGCLGLGLSLLWSLLATTAAAAAENYNLPPSILSYLVAGLLSFGTRWRRGELSSIDDGANGGELTLFWGARIIYVEGYSILGD